MLFKTLATTGSFNSSFEDISFHEKHEKEISFDCQNGVFQQVPLSYELSRMFEKTEPSFSSSVRIEIEGTLPTTKLSMFAYSTADATYYYSFKEETFLKNEANFCCMLGPVINEQDFDYHAVPSFGYVMTEEQEEMLLKEPRLLLPEGYTLARASEDNILTMVENCPHRDRNLELEIEQTRAKTRAFPSSVVHFQGKAVAWAYVYMDGQINNLHVLKEHRNKGLGHIVERDIALKLIKERRPVFKGVLGSNEKFIRASSRSPFWTSHTLPDGRRWQIDDVYVFPKESKR